MPFSSSGTFNPLITFVDNTPATAEDQNAQDVDIAGGLSECLTRSGLAPATAALSLGGFQINNLGPGTAATDAVNLSQITGGYAPLAGATFTGAVVFDTTISATGTATFGAATFSGTATFSGAAIFSGATTVPTPATSDNSQTIVNSAWFIDVLAAGPTIPGTITAASANFSGNVGAAGSVLSSSPSAGVGYKNGVGAGGTVTQATSKSTGVTLNTIAGAITMNNAALTAGNPTSFTLSNTAIAATDVLIVNVTSGSGPYSVGINVLSVGSAQITVENLSGGTLSDAVVIRFVVIKGATS